MGNAIPRVVRVTASYTPELDEDVIDCGTDTGAITITLPAAALNKGKKYTIKDADGNAATNNITVDPAGSTNIEEASTYTININLASIDCVPNAARTAWLVI